MTGWGERYDLELGKVRLLSYSTGGQPDGVEQIMLTGYGSPNRRQHPYFRRKGDVIVAGGTVLSVDDEQLSNQSLTTDGPAHIASVEGIYDAQRDTYDVKFVETVPGSTVSTPPWEARPVKHETHRLPGSYGESYRWDVFIGVSGQVDGLHQRAAASSNATVIDLSSQSSGALLIEGRKV